MICVESERSEQSRAADTFPSAPAGDIDARSGHAPGRREILSLEIGWGIEAPAVIRAALSTVELGDTRDDVLLIASELVTNAVTHSGGSDTDHIHAQVTLDAHGVRVSVRDPGFSDDRPRVQVTDAMSLSGWGLRIVEQLAHRWGFEDDHGIRVWAEVRFATAAIDLRPAPSLPVT